MMLNPETKYWIGWVLLGMVVLVAEFFVVRLAVTQAVKTALSGFTIEVTHGDSGHD